LGFDLLSLDVGAAPAGLDLPGVRDFALPARPLARLEALAAQLDDRARPARPRVTLVEAADGPLPGFGRLARHLAARALAHRGLAVAAGRRVAAVEPEAVVLNDGSRLDAALTAWLPGAAPPPHVAASDLPRAAAGYFAIDATLRAAGGSPVWAAGDCAGHLAAPWLPRAGVHAVRAAPVLAHNLRAAVTGEPPRAFHPRRTALALLDTADGQAIAAWHALAWHGAWCFAWKRRIDEAFVARYRSPAGGV
jgi:selenide,water dikinase